MIKWIKQELIADLAAGAIDKETLDRIVLLSKPKEGLAIDVPGVLFFTYDDNGELLPDDKIVMDLYNSIPEKYQRMFLVIVFE